MTSETENKQTRSHTIRKILNISGLVLLVPFYLLYALWCVGALIYIPGETSTTVRLVTMVLMLMLLGTLPLFQPKRYFIGGGIALMVVFSLLLSTIKPTNDLEWAPEYERLPLIRWEADQDTFTIRDLRDFHFRTTADFVPGYRNTKFKLNELKAIDFVSVYWPQPCEEEIAHVMLRFRFSDGRAFLVSSETRRTNDGEFGAINNLYKQSGKYYVVATESDVLALRTNIREPRERVYIYELELTQEQRNRIFRDLADRINDLHIHPQFYNTLTSNCLTELIPSLRAGLDLPCFHYAFLLSGRTAETLFKWGHLKREPGESFEALKTRSLLNPATENWDHSPTTYSALVRAWEQEKKK